MVVLPVVVQVVALVSLVLMSSLVLVLVWWFGGVGVSVDVDGSGTVSRGVTRTCPQLHVDSRNKLWLR